MRWWFSGDRRTRIESKSGLKCERFQHNRDERRCLCGTSLTRGGTMIYTRERRAMKRTQEMAKNGSVGVQPESRSTSGDWRRHNKIHRGVTYRTIHSRNIDTDEETSEAGFIREHKKHGGFCDGSGSMGSPCGTQE